MKKEELPKEIPVFPLSNFIIFPGSTVPLNIFEPRYIQMVDESMKKNRIIGLIQPKKGENLKNPDLFNVGCIGKITSFNETEDGRYLIILSGIIRFTIIKEIKHDKLFRKFIVNYDNFIEDLIKQSSNLKFSELSLIFEKLKSLFIKKGYTINWQQIKKQNVNEIVDNLSMASPFSLEEKQILLESKNINIRKKQLEEILKTYNADMFNNKTLQ